MPPDPNLSEGVPGADRSPDVDLLLPGQMGPTKPSGDFRFNLASDKDGVDPEAVLDAFLEMLEAVVAVPVVDLKRFVQHGRALGLRPARALLHSQVVSLSDLEGVQIRKRDSINLVPEMVDWEIAAKLPQDFCQMYGIIAYTHEAPEKEGMEGRVIIARSSDLDEYALEAIRSELAPADFKLLWAERVVIAACWQLKPTDRLNLEGDSENVSRNPMAIWQELTDLTGGFMSEATGTNISHLLVNAALKGASDIHIEGRLDGFMDVRYRSLGRMRTLMRWPMSLGEQIVNRFRVVSKVKDNPFALADARFGVHIPEHGDYNVRLSFTPTYVGQMVVMRMLSATAGAEQNLEDVWPVDHSPSNKPSMSERIRSLLASRTNGIVLVSGITGSGKTTTIAAMLHELCKPGDRKVLTAENPVEYSVPGAQQVEIVEWYGTGTPPEGQRTWGNVLRGFMRSDPDVIMIGEIRDEETARIAIRAAQTGHLVLATVHVRDAAGAPARLLDMAPGSEMLVAESLNGVLAQRLIRTLCVACRGRVPESCQKCGGEGFDARTPVGELLVVNDGISEAISKEGAPARLVREAMDDQTQLVDMLTHLLKTEVTTLPEIEWSFGKETAAQAAASASS